MNAPFKKLYLEPRHPHIRSHEYAIHSRDDTHFLLPSPDVKRRRYVDEYLSYYDNFDDPREADVFICKDMRHFVKKILLDSLVAYVVLLEEEKKNVQESTSHILDLMIEITRQEILSRFITHYALIPLSIDFLDYPLNKRLNSYTSFIKNHDESGSLSYKQHCLSEFSRLLPKETRRKLSYYISFLQYRKSLELSHQEEAFIKSFESLIATSVIHNLPLIKDIEQNDLFTVEEKIERYERIIHVTYNLKCEADGPILARLLQFK